MAYRHTPRTERSALRGEHDGDEIEVSGPAYSLRRPVKTALHQAVLDCRIHQARLLVEKHGGDVDARDMYGRTPLMLACLLDNEDYGYRMTRLFMRSGAYLNMRDKMARTALHYACMKGRVQIVARMLKEDDLDLTLQDNDGNTAMMHAALSGNPQLVGILLEVMLRFGLHIDERNGLGYTALLLACKFGHYVTAHILLTRGDAQPDLRDTECYLTAAEWVRKSSSMRNCFLPSRSQTMLEIPQHTLAFSRERTMYTDRIEESPNTARDCFHAPRTAPNPLGRSLGSALQLPNIFKGFSVDRNSETVINGRDARELLLQNIEQVIGNRRSALRRKARSFRSTSGFSTTNRTMAPSTAKLRNIQNQNNTESNDGNRRSLAVADMRVLFKLYSDQFETWKSPRVESHRVRFGSVENTPESAGPVLERTQSTVQATAAEVY